MDDRASSATERKARSTAAAWAAVDPILTLAEAAAYLRFRDPDTLRGMAVRGRVRGGKKGGRWFFRRSALESFLDECRYVTKEEQAERARVEALAAGAAQEMQQG